MNTEKNMAEETISCPSCGAAIPLNAALQERIEKKLRAEYKVDLEKRLATERAKAAEEVREELSVKEADSRAALEEKTKQLEASKKRELELMKKTRELEEAKAEVDLEVERRVQDEKGKLEETVTARITEERRLRDAEKDKQLADMRRTIEELQRKAEQGSQQGQGEVAELDLEAFLRAAFPEDEIVPVPKGTKGADLVQRVHDHARFCGQIVWEVKNTKAWSDGWLTKVRDDQRALKADVAVIASATLPDDVKQFAMVDGVWVTSFASIGELAAALRYQLSQVSLARVAAEGKGTKMEVLYNYLTGTEFKQRVQAMAEAFSAMKEDLDKERQAMGKLWAKREQQLKRALSGVVGMYGDMEGIVGKSLPAVSQLELGPAELPEKAGEE